MLIFCKNALLAPTYCEILASFNPVILTDEAQLLKKLSPNDCLLIDDDAPLADQLSKQNESPAIILIGTDKTPNDEITFIEKPVSAHELLQKVSLLINRQKTGGLINFTINGFTFCGQKRTVNDIPLTQKQAELIELLYENKNRVVSKEEILQTVFGYAQQVQTHTLETHIYKLRQKIADTDSQFIITQDGGYCLKEK